jgi:hypothetical protein
LKANPSKIHWFNLSINSNAIELLEANLDKINWRLLSKNPNAIHLLEANKDKIKWNLMSMNPSIFEPDIKQYNIDLIKKTKIIDNIINSNTKSNKYPSCNLL